MKEFGSRISVEGMSILESMLENGIQCLFSPSFEIHYKSPQIITTRSISIPIERKKYVVIESDWEETPEDAIDFYFISVNLSEKPKGIKVTENNDHTDWIHHHPLSQLCLGAISKVQNIKVFEYEEIGEQEKVIFDSAIIIEREDGIKICITHEHSIKGELEVIFLNEEIERVRSQMKLKKVFS